MSVQNIDFSDINTSFFDGVDLDNIVLDSEVLFTAIKFSATWDGHALGHPSNSMSGTGIETSGSNFRSVENLPCGGGVPNRFGNWLTANGDGTFSGGTSESVGYSGNLKMVANNTNVLAIGDRSGIRGSWSHTFENGFSGPQVVCDVAAGYTFKITPSGHNVQAIMKLDQDDIYGSCGTGIATLTQYNNRSI